MSVSRSVLAIVILMSPSLYAEEPVEQTVEEPTEQPAEEGVEEPVEQAVEEPTEQPAEEGVEEPIEQVVEEPAAQDDQVDVEGVTPDLPVEMAEVEEGGIEQVVSPWTTVLPFGIPQFAQGESKRGWIYVGVQGVGLAASIYTGLEMRRLAVEEEVDRELTYRLVSAGTVALTALTWFASVVDGSNMRIEAIDRAQAVRDWEVSQRSALVLAGE